MKTISMLSHITLICLSLTPSLARAQGMYDRLPDKLSQQATFLFGYDLITGSVHLTSVATGSGYLIPIDYSSTNHQGVTTIVTAKHVLYHKIPGPHIFDATNLLDGILVKFYVTSSNGEAFFMQIPLKKNAPHNFWVSERNLDLAVIPLPSGKMRLVDNITFKEYQVVTPERAVERGVIPGLLVAIVSLQPEYFHQIIDMIIPETTPIIRIGHLARLGWQRLPNGQVLTREHIVDLHTSPAW